MLFLSIWSLLQWYMRPFIKWFLRKTTRLCELQRICYGEEKGAARSIKVETSLTLSRTHEVKEVISYLDAVILERRIFTTNLDDVLKQAVSIIMKVKQINIKYHSRFSLSLQQCLEQIWNYKQLLIEVEDLRKMSFDSENDEHEQKLLLLWNLLMPNEALTGRITKQWQDIGFQVCIS